MQKALLLTDGSVDSALSLSRWLENQPDQRIDLTIVHAYEIPANAGHPLKAVSCQAAKQEAIHTVTNWVSCLPTPWPGPLKTEVLPGNDHLVLTIYLLLRPYDSLLLSFWQEDALSAFIRCQRQIMTKLHWLNLPETIPYAPTKY